MAGTLTTIPAVAELTPSHAKGVISGNNYLDITQASFWAQQYMPELYEAEVERYGDRSVSGFLSAMGAEIPMASDSIVWSEQGRLHLSYTGTVTSAGVITVTAAELNGGSHGIRKGQTIVANVGTVGSDSGGITADTICYVDAVTTNTLTVYPYRGSDSNGLLGSVTGFPGSGAPNITFFVFGSEFAKGTSGMVGSVEPQVQTFDNRPIILKDRYSVSGSDAAQIGWIEVSGEAGQNGYLWYLKAEGDTRTRFNDYLEMSMIESVKGDTDTSIVETKILPAVTQTSFGTEGMFAAIKARGLLADNCFTDAGVTDATNGTIKDFEVILKELDKQGAIEENMLFLNRDASLAMDDALAGISLGSAGGVAYGLFDNAPEMALNLGFTGFRRGSYDFYKTDWKYLNNKSTRNGFATIEGCLVPAGTSSVYDQGMGKNVRRPFLHVRYRANEADNRLLKSWIVGSVGGASNSDEDAMNVHYLSERCLVTQAANNFCLFLDVNGSI